MACSASTPPGWCDLTGGGGTSGKRSEMACSASTPGLDCWARKAGSSISPQCLHFRAVARIFSLQYGHCLYSGGGSAGEGTGEGGIGMAEGTLTAAGLLAGAGRGGAMGLPGTVTTLPQFGHLDCLPAARSG